LGRVRAGAALTQPRRGAGDLPGGVGSGEERHPGGRRRGGGPNRRRSPRRPAVRGGARAPSRVRRRRRADRRDAGLSGSALGARGGGPVIRLGRIGYVNMAPVFYRVEAEFDEVVGVPTALNAALLDGECDLAPISSIEYARHADRLRLLPRLCVSSEGAVDSIQLVSRAPAGLSELEAALVASVRLARAEPERLAYEASERYGYPAGFLARYFEKLRYRFGPRERAGLLTFLELARDAGELDRVPELRFV